MKAEKHRPDPGQFDAGFWRSHWREAVVLTVVVFALYGASISYGFVLDDQMVITKNEYTQQGFAGIPKILTRDSFEGYLGERTRLVAGARYRPLSLITFAVEHAMFGQNSRVSHLVGIVFYVLCSLLVFRLASLLFADTVAGPWYFTTAFLAAVLYAVHPVHSEVVANVKGRDEILAMIGSLGALYGAVRYLGRGSRLWWALSGVSLFVGLLAKENAITWLAVIPLVLFFFFRVEPRRVILALAPALTAAAAYLAIRSNAVGPLFSGEAPISDLLNNPFVDMSFAERYATVFYTLGLYVKLLFFPHPLTYDYYPYHIPVMHWGRIESILSLTLYAGMVAYAIVATGKKRLGAFCVLFFLVTLSVTSNLFFPVGVFMSERFLFMPSLAFCIGIAYVLAGKLYPKNPAVGSGIALVVILSFGLKTAARVPVWENPLSLARSAVAVSKNSAKANCSLGIALYDLSRETDDRAAKSEYLDEAERYLERSLEIYPKYRVANQVLSSVLGERFALDGDLESLLGGFEAAIARDPEVEYIQRYANYLKDRGRHRRRLVEFYHRVGYEILALGKQRYDMALRYVGFGLELDRDDPMLNLAAGRIYALSGDDAKAEAFLARAYRLDPTLRRP